MAGPQPNRGEHPLWDFATRALIAVAIAAAAYLLWRIRFPLLTAFAAVLLAVLLVSLSDLLSRFARVPHGWALLIAIGLIVGVIAGLGLLVGTQVRTQFGELWRALPEASQSVERRLGIQLPGDPAGPGGMGDPAGPRGAEADRSTPGAPAIEQILGAGQSGETSGAAGGTAGGTAANGGGVQSAVLSRAMDWLASYGLTIVDAILGLILVVVAGVYLAIDPAHYHRGAVKLFPPPQHALVDETMTEVGQTLRWWLLGKLIAMAIIGALAGVGTWLLGLPAPLALGIFAAMTEFVPIIGPIVGAVPALLLAATQGMDTVLWTLLLFLGIQQIESNIVAPLVQERMVTIPAALLVLGVGLFGALFGLLGLVLSGPLLVVSYVAVKKLWLRRALNESTPMPTDAARR
jgi:predicted PurR-regulated permease PerM